MLRSVHHYSPSFDFVTLILRDYRAASTLNMEEQTMMNAVIVKTLNNFNVWVYKAVQRLRHFSKATCRKWNVRIRSTRIVHCRGCEFLMFEYEHSSLNKTSLRVCLSHVGDVHTSGTVQGFRVLDGRRPWAVQTNRSSTQWKKVVSLISRFGENCKKLFSLNYQKLS